MPLPRCALAGLAAVLCASACIIIAPLPAAAEAPAILAQAQPAEAVDFELYFPIRNGAELDALIGAQNRPGSSAYHRWLTPVSFAARYGPTDATVANVTAELATRGLAVTQRQGLMLHVTGSAAAVDAAFGITLEHARFSDGSESLVADRPLTMPAAIAASGALTPQFTTARPRHKDSAIVGPVPQNFIGPTGPYLAADLRQAYDFPAATAISAKGVNIGILMSGNYDTRDIYEYFYYDGVPASLFPARISSIPINGGLAYSSSNSGETLLDIEQAGAMSLGANITLYNLSDLKYATIAAGLNRIVSDNVADVVNMSFGGPEADLTAANNNGVPQFGLLEIEDRIFKQGVSQGITFVASSGDDGAIPPVGASQKPTLSADDPASDPYVVAVGGTNLVTQHVAHSNTSAYVSENEYYDREKGGAVWASGGGVSIYWAKPAYQSLVPTPSSKYRTVPDLAQHMGGCPGTAIACHTPHSYDYEFIGGQAVEVTGTSASSPDTVAMFALKIALTHGRLGLEDVDVYTRAKAQNAGKGAAFHHKGIPGNNGYYATAVPYDLVIGNGSVDARQFLGATSLPAAGIPGTSSNP